MNSECDRHRLQCAGATIATGGAHDENQSTRHRSVCLQAQPRWSRRACPRARSSNRNSSAPQQPSSQQPNILFIMGDDIGWMQPSIYHRGLMVGRDAQHRPHRQRRRDLHGLLRRAELHGRAQRLLHRHASAAHRHDPAATAGQPVLPATRHPGARQVPARPRLQHRRVRQEPSGRPHRRAADGARLPGVLGLPVPPRRHAGRELPRHQQEPDRAGHRAAVQEHADPGPCRSARRCGPEDHDSA